VKSAHSNALSVSGCGVIHASVSVVLGASSASCQSLTVVLAKVEMLERRVTLSVPAEVFPWAFLVVFLVAYPIDLSAPALLFFFTGSMLSICE